MATVYPLLPNDPISTTYTNINDSINNLNTDKEEIANKSTSVTTDQASNTKYPSVKSVYDWATTTLSKYLGDADFYQYSIVRTVSGGNLTVALKNYEGNDPTPSVPVKIMIGGVVRTITSALNVSGANAGDSGTNYLNLGSAELATKEADLFIYLGWATAGSTVNMFLSRIPTAVLYEDFTPLNSAEKGRMRSLNVSPTNGDPVVNIGRFNAILSGGAGYTWSTPGTSMIINDPILQTRYLDYTPVGAGYTAGGARYRIDGNNLNLIVDSTANITGNITTPFTSANTVDNQMTTSAGTAVLPKNSNTITVATNPQNISGFYGI